VGDACLHPFWQSLASRVGGKGEAREYIDLNRIALTSLAVLSAHCGVVSETSTAAWINWHFPSRRQRSTATGLISNRIASDRIPSGPISKARHRRLR
jgi:hypothetical protein